jgi:hypothetical protein
LFGGLPIGLRLSSVMPRRDSVRATKARLDSYFAESITQNNEMLVDVIAEENHEMVKAIIKQREEIGSLRAELEVLRSIVRGEVTSIKGKASDAA